MRLHGTSAIMVALLIFAAAADAQQRGPVGGGPRNPIATGGGQAGDGGRLDGRHRDRGHKRASDIFLIEQEVVEVVEVEKEAKPAEMAAAAPAAPAAPEKKREPYKVGNSYDSLPGGCMKMIEDGASYYFCGGGEWYRQVGSGQYKAVAQP